ncbi:MAG: putative transport system permease protein, partial [Mucilaginibacter sp.]|nr:putative transport system permease protein [Mucilaginibacter sp.]
MLHSHTVKFFYIYGMPVKTTYKENIAIALQSIGGNRLRTSLTALI